MSEMAEKLKTSNNRVKTLVSKAKAYEAEASDIDELIFRKNFIFSGMSFVSCSSQLGV
jgi:ATP-dependent RNA circularization protein (DNA/RNA ligase family)